ncbi:MAG: hypothetical protein IJJ99_04190 [Oscillospiraceae bacterium]|nr:hypothetical protein [Oscillospiraceae bacterium]
MKKAVLFLLILSLAISLFACAGSSAELTAEDLAICIGGFTVTVKTTMEDVRAALGEADDYAEAISCVYEGMDKTFTYGDVTFYTYPDGETDCLMEVYCTGGDVKTAKGITFGASVDEIEAAYGKSYTQSGKLLTYELPVSGEDLEPASLYFVLENERVAAIAMTAEHRAE